MDLLTTRSRLHKALNQHAESILNSMCDPERAPLIDEIDGYIKRLRNLRAEASK